MPGKAVIWDMDGVIVDSGTYHLQSWQYVFSKRGVVFTESDFQRVFGMRNDAIIRLFLPGTRDEEVKEIAGEKEKYFREQVRQNIRAFPGAVELIKKLPEHGFKTSVASSAPMANIKIILDGLRLTGYFNAIVTGEDVTESKPSPQTFLLAAKKLEVTPQQSIVIEDAIAGVQAAKRAGMRCIAVTNTNPREALANADMLVDSLEEVSVESLEELLT